MHHAAFPIDNPPALAYEAMDILSRPEGPPLFAGADGLPRYRPVPYIVVSCTAFTAAQWWEVNGYAVASADTDAAFAQWWDSARED